MRTFRQFFEAQWAEPSLDYTFNLQTQLDHLEEEPSLQNFKDFLRNLVKPVGAVLTELNNLRLGFNAWVHNNTQNYDEQPNYNAKNQIDSNYLHDLEDGLHYFRAGNQILSVGGQINQVDAKGIIHVIDNITENFDYINNVISNFIKVKRPHHNLFEQIIRTLTSLQKYINETKPLLKRARMISKQIAY